MDPVDDFLAHHGIKGMKWGVRRAERARANSDRMQDIARQRPTAFNRVAAQRIERKADKLETRQQHKLDKYGDKSKGPLTPEQRQHRRERALKVAAGAAVIAFILTRKVHVQNSNWKPRPDAGRVSKTVKDLINEERDVKVSALIRTHKEGHIDKDQLENFLRAINARYDRKLFNSD